ncbi:MAG: zinc-dependent metalloprotease [Microthrixaceae bacterium]|nr:zinc-dependent metalloprotease [Microthrixaceae bacterium]
MSGAIDWKVAERVASLIAGDEPFANSYHYQSLAPDFEELTAQAQELVEEHLGWGSLRGDARSRVASRRDWIQANIVSFQRMLRPLTAKIEDKLAAGVLSPITGRLAGAEMGAVLGWMATRVLGQYDMLILEEESDDDQDIVYYVGPNILSLEKRFGFPPREFRLWIALHEVTHRTQFTGVSWLREYFLDQVNGMLGNVDPDPAQFFRAIGRVAEALRTGRSPLADGGVVTLFATPEQRATMERIGGLMSLLEGHGDVTMDRAGGAALPSAERFGRVLRERRRQQSGPARILQRLIGLEAKLAQYEQGERFIETVEREGGAGYLNRAFESAEQLPTLAEIRDPSLWMARVEPRWVAAGS